MQLQCKVSDISRHLKEEEYKDADHILQYLKEKTLSDPCMIGLHFIRFLYICA